MVNFVQPSSQPFPPGRLPAPRFFYKCILTVALLFLDPSVHKVIPKHIFKNNI